MEKEQKRALLESILFISGTPVNLKDLQKITEFSTGEISFLINELMAEYRNRKGGILLVEVAEGYQMVSNPDYSYWVKKIKATTPQKLSIAALETLSIVAYRQPITKAELEQLRGVNSDGVIKSLLERRFIRIVGKKEVPGRPLIYGTSREFLQHFGLKDLSELPTMRDLNPDEL
ncbi:Segregation and condensation protein B [hydrothermal vent metagenome]|uniref:Segregation and condensation protein B n=1 Tax=hydrothermal vent metagenome TaxID=652676 RepID=A0A3B1DDI4_9ZZZZ